jgi:hypothetical protein
MMRYVDETSASIWVETRDAALVTVKTSAGEWAVPTFAVHGHHYALVEVDGLEPGTVTPYAVDINGTRLAGAGTARGCWSRSGRRISAAGNCHP